MYSIFEFKLYCLCSNCHRAFLLHEIHESLQSKSHSRHLHAAASRWKLARETRDLQRIRLSVCALVVPMSSKKISTDHVSVAIWKVGVFADGKWTPLWITHQSTHYWHNELHIVRALDTEPTAWVTTLIGQTLLLCQSDTSHRYATRPYCQTGICLSYWSESLDIAGKCTCGSKSVQSGEQQLVSSPWKQICEKCWLLH